MFSAPTSAATPSPCLPDPSGDQLNAYYREGAMRGDEQRQVGFIVLTSLEDRVPEGH
jgi:hypothetical protein